MKRIIALITLVSILAILLTGCGKINVEKSVEYLKSKGMTENVTYKTAAELEYGSEFLNTEIEFWGGDFTVRLKDYTTLIADRDITKSVQFITFSSKREAQAYAELYIKSRDEYSNTKVAQSGSVVVITNLEFVIRELDVEFE